MTLAQAVQLLRLANLIVCAAGVHPALRLLRIASYMGASGQKKVSIAFRVLAAGLLCVTVGNALVFVVLLWQRASVTLWPGVWMIVTNSLLVTGLYLLQWMSKEDNRDRK